MCPLPHGTAVSLFVNLGDITSGKTFHQSSEILVKNADHLDFPHYEAWMLDVMQHIARSTRRDVWRIIRRPNAYKHCLHVFPNGTFAGPSPYGQPVSTKSDFRLPTSPADPYGFV
jgi:hypothetical protein